MIHRATVVLLAIALLSQFSAGLVARPTTRAARPNPSTRPAATQATRPAATLPTNAELARQIQELRARQAEMSNVAYFDFGQPVIEKPAGFTLFGDDGITLQSVLGRLNAAERDKSLRAVLLTLRETQINLAQAQELRDALNQLRRAGKRTFVYADSYDTTGYIVASGATDICLLGGGQIVIPGIGLETMFAKGLLDKVGVKADYVQIGEYKGADEQFTRTEPSPELRGELNKLVDSLFGQLVDGIALQRNISRAKVKELVDDTFVSARVAKERGLVDHLTDIDGLRPLIAKELGREVTLIADYGIPEKESIDFSNPFALFALLSRNPVVPDKPAIALVYVEGMIVDGDGGESLLGDSAVGSEQIRKAVRLASRDENVEAIVIRIDSPGGSALASEVMWQSIRRAADEKPVVISIGSMAASGGYYVASAGDHIFADPCGIVGSIGVVGGKFVMKDLFEAIGLRTEAFTRGRNADLFSNNKPFSDQQRRLVTNWMRETYDQFTERVMTTRKGKIKDIDEVARGRIFAAKQARDLGMVDELGGLQDAIAFAAREVDLDGKDYIIRTVPTPKTLIDLLRGADVDAKLPSAPRVQLSADSVLRALSPSTARLVGQQIRSLLLLQNRPVMLVSPFTVTLK